MKMIQEQTPSSVLHYFVRLYAFLKDRDAKIIEMYFLGFHLWVLVVIALPVHVFHGEILALVRNIAPQIILVICEMLIVAINMTALIYDKKYVRIVNALVNVASMSFISTGFALVHNANVGTYALLGVLAAFVCWKINIKT